MITVDTHTLIWLRNSEPRLGNSTNTMLSRAQFDGELAASSAVLFEAAQLHLKGRVDLGMPPRAWAQDCMDIGLRIIPVSAHIAIESSMLGTSGFHGDPLDRFITATAIVGGHSLVTADRQIIQWAERTRLLEIMDPAP
ncbi:type II toxin-antitoxin system VapC family toxin [Candidatus Poriferisocius sp.]|uniref:type II toxin-antitoxin system VapC family toxin n=1 Tax=Candidatus Poriferisocius sp. TaxID=3101276 RepID=UPI003B0266B7